MVWFERGPGVKKGSDGLPDPALKSDGSGERGPVDSAGDELIAYLYKGSQVTGQITFHGPAQINGNVNGEILCHGMLTIGEGAEVRAKVSGEVVIIRGRVEGDVAAKERVVLEAPARLLGNIDAPRLAIAEGVVFDGYCSMGESKGEGVVNPLALGGEAALGESRKFLTESEK